MRNETEPAKNGAVEIITASRFFDGAVLRGPTAITLRNGLIQSMEEHDGPCEHSLLSPGFLDIQMNGFGSVSCAGSAAGVTASDMAALDSMLLAKGTTRWLATLVTDDLSRVVSRADAVRAASTGAPGCLGVHLEGPFLGSRLGAHDRARVRPPDISFALSPPAGTLLVTTGAEDSEAPAFIRGLASRGVVVSLGHTAPDRGRWDACVRAGASMVTHLFNAMPQVHHRDDSITLMALVDDRVHLGLIADLVHVSADAVRLAFAAAPGRVCLVSDSVAWNDAGSRRRGIELRDGAPRLPDGTLAGSSTALGGCVRNVVNSCGVELAAALGAATVIPARILGMHDMVTPAPGREANLIALDDSLCVTAAWRGLQSVRDLAPLS
ncbi:MAG: hypothetical protein RLZZ305_1047 [Actinomycetota bacterium]